MKLGLLCLLAACGDGSASDLDAGLDARPDAPPGCTRPALDAPWLADLLTTGLAALAATPRASVSERTAAQHYLTDQLAGLGWAPTTQPFPGGTNVYATIPATIDPPGKEIIVGAHLDTVIGSPGANDNATGCVVVLAVARYLKDLPCRTAPVTVILFDQEEAGLFGSRAFAQQRTPAMIRAVHTIDQVGWDSDGDRRFEVELPTPELEAEYRAAAAVVGVPVTTTSTEGTDHQSFRDRGFAAVGLTEEYVGGDTSPFRHQAGDTPDTVDATYLQLAARLAGQVVLDEVAP